MRSAVPSACSTRTTTQVAFAPYASRSPFEVWVVPRRHDADFARGTDPDLAATAEALRQVLGRLADRLDGPPYNLVLHTAPLKEQVDATFHWHWEIHPRLREIAGLELGTGLPVNPVSPEDAVEELRASDPDPEPSAMTCRPTPAHRSTGDQRHTGRSPSVSGPNDAPNAHPVQLPHAEVRWPLASPVSSADSSAAGWP